METQTGSPNWHWDRLGYTIERKPRRLGNGNIRTIRDTDGNVVLHGASYEQEMEHIEGMTRSAA
ncbi:hypothetical protein [Salinicola halophilus]|uniref:hypothetical protein n=1 Tax=Salinicola halophilus TaxID=184065 RepID=UPI000DA1DFE3|nr:hypothetical protein [Salinicola halophilus]